MSNDHSPHDDIVYDLISIQYHALQSASHHQKYMDDVHDHTDVADFLRKCEQEDRARADKCHELIKSVMGAHEHQNA